jgi:ribonuclease P/MRP protein subunit RPP1
MKFYDFGVHPYPEGTTPLDRLCEVARMYGYSGIAVTNHDVSYELNQFTLFDRSIEGGMNGFELFRGIEIVSGASGLRQKIREQREKVSVLCVHGGEERINRIAVEDKKVDILCHPERCGVNLNHILVKLAAQNGVAIEFNIGNIVHKRGSARSRLLSRMRGNLLLARKYSAPMILTSNAYSIYDLRAPREMIALARLFGMRKEEAIEALSEMPMRMIGRENVLMDGVEIVY